MAAKSKKKMKKALPKKTSKPKAAKGKKAVKKAKPVKALVAKAPQKKSNVNISAFLSPLDDRLVVLPEEAPTKTAGGLIIPGGASDRPARGEVVAKGPGRRSKKGKLRPLDVKVGDQVLFAEYSGTKLTFEGKDVLILREEDVLGIVT